MSEGCGRTWIAEYRYGMGIGLGLELGSGVRAWVMAMAWGQDYFEAVTAVKLCNFSQFYAFRTAQMRNGHMTLRLGLSQWLVLGLWLGLGFRVPTVMT